MLKATRSFAETTASVAITDVLDDAMRSLHISGSLLLRESYTPPWAIAVPSADSLAAMLGARSGTIVVAFHLVEFGHCEVRPQGADAVTLAAGDMAVCFGGGAHRLSLGKPVKPQPIETLLAGSMNVRRPVAVGEAVGTSLLCGVFLLKHTDLNPLFSALPPLMRVKLSRPGELHNLSGVAHLMADEIDRTRSGRSYIVDRLLEVLCAEAMRAYAESVPRHEVGWFRGIKDPVVCRAMSVIHSAPAENWSVQGLARTVSMSPSRFAARFSGAVGDSPMAYVSKWRMNLACRKLASSRAGVDQIAAEVGYESVAAFNRAFKKHLGLPPAAWRSRALQEAVSIALPPQ